MAVEILVETERMKGTFFSRPRILILLISGLLKHYSPDHPDYRDCKGKMITTPDNEMMDSETENEERRKLK